MSDFIIPRIFNSNLIEQRTLDGFINGTAMSRANGKNISDWLALESTFELVSALASRLGLVIKFIEDLSPTSIKTRVSAAYPMLVVSKMGSPENGGGTWIHPKLATSLGMWCNPQFALQVADWVEEWLTSKSQQPEPPPQHTSVYIKRILEQDHKVPYGHWSVFNASEKVLLHIETKLKLPVASYDLCDGSIGIRWGKYCKSKEWVQPSTTYQHIFKDQRGARQCHAYSDVELKYFRQWLDTKYIPDYLPAYLATKYSDLAC